jgi:hypothetical protein
MRVLMRGRRRHRSAAGDAGDARSLSSHTFYVVGKVDGLEDVRLALQKMSTASRASGDRAALTNLAYADAPWLAVKSPWPPEHGVAGGAARGQFAYRFGAADHRLEPPRRRTGRPACRRRPATPVYDRPVVMVIYREDHKFCRSDHPAARRHDGKHDLVMASQPYRARASLDFKAKRDRAARHALDWRAADRHPFARQRSRLRSSRRCGRATIRSSTTATRS